MSARSEPPRPGRRARGPAAAGAQPLTADATAAEGTLADGPAAGGSAAQPAAATAWRAAPLPAGLHLVAVPIGAARDITLRALDILAAADVLAAEDTRSLRRLMDIHGIPLRGRPLVAYHDHNGAAVRPRLIAALAAGRTVAFAPEAGTPLVADPGFQLARAARAAGHPVTAAPGPSALLAALAVSGLPTDRFLFAGFPPAAKAAHERFLRELADTPATVVIFESPGRINRTLDELVRNFGEGRRIALCRELTKRFEDVMTGTAAEVRDRCRTQPPRGEIVLVIDRAEAAAADDAGVDILLRDALDGASLRDAVDAVAARTGLPRGRVYRAALAIAGGPNGDRPDRDGGA